MRGLFLLIKLLGAFVKAARAGEPWALWVTGLIVAVILAVVIIAFARKPLGGDPEKTPLDLLDDHKNPYRDFT